MYSFSAKPAVNKNTMGLIHSAFPDPSSAVRETDIAAMTYNEEKKTSNGSKMGPALFTLHSVSNDIEYPTSNSILKTQDSYKSEVFTSELYESCILSFSIVQVVDNISIGLNNNNKYYGLYFKDRKYSIILNGAIKSDIDTPPGKNEFFYEIGDVFKIIHLSNEINIFKNDCKIYISKKKESENDSYRALFTLSNKEDEIRNIQFYYIYQNKCNYLKQGPTIILTNPISNNIKISDCNSFYLLEGSSSVISGITKGKNGQHIIIINGSGNSQTFSDNDIGSLWENRLCLGGNNIDVKNEASIQFLYVSDLNKWVLL